MKSYSICLFLCGLFHFSQFSCSVMSDSLQPHGLQHARPPCSSPTPEVCSNSCPSSWWCHPTISSFIFPFSSCLQSFPASGYFLVSQFFASGGQSIGVSTSASVFNEYSGPISFRMDWLDLLAVPGLSRVYSNTTIQNAALNMPANLETLAGNTELEKVHFHSSPKERACQRKFKLPQNCTHFTCQQSNAQNSPS